MVGCVKWLVPTSSAMIVLQRGQRQRTSHRVSDLSLNPSCIGSHDTRPTRQRLEAQRWDCSPELLLTLIAGALS
jgi:hypothetical protein